MDANIPNHFSKYKKIPETIPNIFFEIVGFGKVGNLRKGRGHTSGRSFWRVQKQLGLAIFFKKRKIKWWTLDKVCEILKYLSLLKHK